MAAAITFLCMRWSLGFSRCLPGTQLNLCMCVSFTLLLSFITEGLSRRETHV